MIPSPSIRRKAPCQIEPAPGDEGDAPTVMVGKHPINLRSGQRPIRAHRIFSHKMERPMLRYRRPYRGLLIERDPVLQNLSLAPGFPSKSRRRPERRSHDRLLPQHEA
jgi:hypothetical protein